MGRRGRGTEHGTRNIERGSDEPGRRRVRWENQVGKQGSIAGWDILRFVASDLQKRWAANMKRKSG